MRPGRGRAVARRAVLPGLIASATTLLALALSSTPVTAAGAFTPPPVRHVWVINLENTSYRESFGDALPNEPHPYLKNVLPSRGVLLSQYYGIGHNSLDNYIAELSGQGPTPQTQSDCILPPTEWSSADPPVDPHGQAIGEGCIYPSKVKTLADQLDAKGLSWKGYMAGLGDAATPGSTTYGDDEPCGHVDANGNGASQYAAKHNPFVWFHSIVDQPTCAKRVVPLTDLGRDLGSIATTPNLNFITPDMFDDSHDAGLDVADRWLRRWVPLIAASPAYRQDGMLVITFDEAHSDIVGVTLSPQDDNAACCNEIPGPNSPMPGIGGPGGGRVGAVILSPYVKPGTTTDDPFNHYSLLRSLEDGFGITTGGDDGQGHLGYAGSYDAVYPGPGSFGCDVYTAYGPCQSPAQPPGPAPTPASAGQTGPRPADGSTTWRNPLPTSNDLASISCPSAATCFAAGDAGTIVATTNGGASWSTQRSGIATGLRGISCPTATACIAAGEAGTIVATGDGGATWTPQQSGTAENLNAVSCATATNCTAVGDRGGIVATTDGGQSWSPQSSGVDSPLFGVSCPDESTCYAVGDLPIQQSTTTGPVYRAGVLKTADGGASWTLLNANIDDWRLRAISCPNASTCLGASNGITQMWRTTDGGATWSGRNGGGNFFGAACASATSCVAVGKGQRYSANGPPAGVIASTSDGSNYSQQNSGTGDTLRAVACPTASECITVGDRGTIVARADGATWSMQTQTATALPAPFASQLQPPTSAPQLAGASCPTTSACFAVGDFGLLAASGNGGSHWSAQASGTDERLNAVGCATATDCVATGDDGTIVGTANGATWSPQSSGTKEALVGASCPTASVCFAVGDRGTVLATTNHGATWRAQSSRTNANLNSVSCVSAKTCVAVGSLGTILRTTNGGSTWSAGQSGTAAYLGGASCGSAKSCVAVGQDGLVLTSGDGGTRWSAGHPVGDELDAVSCASSTSCVATGSSGAVLSSADGGGTWTVQGTGTARSLAAVSCPSTTGCIAAGDTGTILGIAATAVRTHHGR